MQSYYSEQFERELGCTERDWLRWLPSAIGAFPYQMLEGKTSVQFEPGSLSLSWCVAEPLRIALIRMPRLRVRFAFEGLSEVRRHAFMQRFDLHMQRGGG
jgi:hypothetical protein